MYTLLWWFPYPHNGQQERIKKEFFQKVASKLGIKHQFSRPDHPQSSSILEKFHSILKAHVHQHIHCKLIGKILNSFHTLVLGFFLTFILERPFSLLFDRYPLSPHRKLLTPTFRY